MDTFESSERGGAWRSLAPPYYFTLENLPEDGVHLVIRGRISGPVSEIKFRLNSLQDEALAISFPLVDDSEYTMKAVVFCKREEEEKKAAFLQSEVGAEVIVLFAKVIAKDKDLILLAETMDCLAEMPTDACKLKPYDSKKAYKPRKEAELDVKEKRMRSSLLD
ncbi:hypothetical protein WR25_22342 [Diploscapter pachys]|uniref:Uncharacterized protein n=1 Tax=Diploscapter pachys TaxID=2018661 RepID=A0A2A2KMG3_9BILA|nr:hypothetical protein WR25_22342 [Diploscapter pachys]